MKNKNGQSKYRVSKPSNIAADKGSSIEGSYKSVEATTEDKSAKGSCEDEEKFSTRSVEETNPSVKSVFVSGIMKQTL